MNGSDIPVENVASVGDENVDRIRDILFGAQMKEYDRRIEQIAVRFRSDNEKLRQELSDRLLSLDGFCKTELDRLNSQFSAERQERIKLLSDLGKRVADAERELLEHIESVDKKGTEERLELRNEIMDQAHSMSEALRQRSEEIISALDSETGRLSREKTGREEISRLMTEMAMRLSGDFQLPEA